MTHRALLAATAIALAGTTAAFADAHTDSPFSITTIEYGERYLASTLIGESVHVADTEIMPGVALAAGTVDEWDDIGEIGDLIVGVDGTLQAVVLDIGGFLGIGERQVAIDWSALRPVYEEDNLEEYFLGLNVTQEQLEAAPELERTDADG
ncbi:PRC-barrel domain-containing protein [Jannaschia donghaensis]|uniref:Uncharacterized protein n=1 Tax=Jannaschia donghaensis TaxID=420998 RepID=A0A0M6YIA6_9RHOB|nr:PRC-barrel domain-containing protein [Jannaschia donghaensis]CTQ49405.1 hypothetical protein JDO7802_01418 [Jannaschia donghaensis]